MQLINDNPSGQVMNIRSISTEMETMITLWKIEESDSEYSRSMIFSEMATRNFSDDCDTWWEPIFILELCYPPIPHVSQISLTLSTCLSPEHTHNEKLNTHTTSPFSHYRLHMFLALMTFFVTGCYYLYKELAAMLYNSCHDLPLRPLHMTHPPLRNLTMDVVIIVHLPSCFMSLTSLSQ